MKLNEALALTVRPSISDRDALNSTFSKISLQVLLDSELDASKFKLIIGTWK